MRVNEITFLIAFGLILGFILVPVSSDMSQNAFQEAVSSRTTFTVGPTGDYSTIQAGIDAVASGDTLQVAAGVYAEFVIIPTGKTVHLLGDGASTTYAFSVSKVG